MHWRSKLIHPGTRAPADFRSLATPTYRGSTVIADLEQALNAMDPPA
jgi:cystathionine beta-lyase